MRLQHLSYAAALLSWRTADSCMCLVHRAFSAFVGNHILSDQWYTEHSALSLFRLRCLRRATAVWDHQGAASHAQLPVAVPNWLARCWMASPACMVDSAHGVLRSLRRMRLKVACTGTTEMQLETFVRGQQHDGAAPDEIVHECTGMEYDQSKAKCNTWRWTPSSWRAVRPLTHTTVIQAACLLHWWKLLAVVAPGQL